MKKSRKDIRGKLLSYVDIQLSLNKLDPIKDREAYEACVDKLAQIVQMVNLIPIGSREYNAVRLKYIERRSWVSIEREMHLSDRACRSAATHGLDIIARKFFE